MAAASASGSDGLWSAFLGGTSPRLLLEDIYRFGEDYLCDVSDSLEVEVQRLCEEQLKKVRGRVSRGGAASAAKAAGPTDTALRAEIASGADSILDTMVQAYELAGDQFEVYARRNVFAWPEGLEYPPTGGAPTSSGKLYAASFEEALAARVRALEAKVAAERKRRRTLEHLKGLLSKRVPQAEAASRLLEEVMASLQPKAAASSGSSASAGSSGAPGEAFREFFEHAGRLQALCQRLSAASPAAAAAVGAALSAPEAGGDEGGAAAGAAEAGAPGKAGTAEAGAPGKAGRAQRGQGGGGAGEAQRAAAGGEGGEEEGGEGEGEEEQEEDVLRSFAADTEGKK